MIFDALLVLFDKLLIGLVFFPLLFITPVVMLFVEVPLLGISIVILLYLITSSALYLIAVKLNHVRPILAWVPFVKYGVLLELAGFRRGWMFSNILLVVSSVSFFFLFLEGWSGSSSYPDWVFIISTILFFISFIVFMIQFVVSNFRVSQRLGYSPLFIFISIIMIVPYFLFLILVIFTLVSNKHIKEKVVVDIKEKVVLDIKENVLGVVDSSFMRVSDNLFSVPFSFFHPPKFIFNFILSFGFILIIVLSFFKYLVAYLISFLIVIYVLILAVLYIKSKRKILENIILILLCISYLIILFTAMNHSLYSPSSPLKGGYCENFPGGACQSDSHNFSLNETWIRHPAFDSSCVDNNAKSVCWVRISSDDSSTRLKIKELSEQNFPTDLQNDSVEDISMDLDDILDIHEGTISVWLYVSNNFSGLDTIIFETNDQRLMLFFDTYFSSSKQQHITQIVARAGGNKKYVDSSSSEGNFPEASFIIDNEGTFSDSGLITDWYSFAPLKTHEWHLITMTWNRYPSGIVKLFVDGDLVGKKMYFERYDNHSTLFSEFKILKTVYSAPFSFETFKNAPFKFLSQPVRVSGGELQVKDFMLYSRALTSLEIQNLI